MRPSLPISSAIGHALEAVDRQRRAEAVIAPETLQCAVGLFHATLELPRIGPISPQDGVWCPLRCSVPLEPCSPPRYMLMRHHCRVVLLVQFAGRAYTRRGRDMVNIRRRVVRGRFDEPRRPAFSFASALLTAQD